MKPPIPQIFLAVLLTAALSHAGLANPKGVWALDGNFNGASIVYPAMNALTLTAGTDYSFGFDAENYSFLQSTVFTPKSKMLKVGNNTGPNGGPGATRTNRWTVAMDIKFDNLQPYAGIIQLDPTNNSDESFYTASSNNVTASIATGLGLVAPAGTIAINTWYRLVFTCGNDGAGGPLLIRCFVNGVQAGPVRQAAFDGNYAMRSTFNLLSDDDGQLQPVKLGAVALWGEELYSGDIQALGGPKPSGIPDTAVALSFRNLAGIPGGAGSADGTGPAARFNYPLGLAAGAGGSVFVSDTNNHTIRKIASGAVTTTLAGSSGYSGTALGNGSGARFANPAGTAVDSSGNVYICDQGLQVIRRITPAGDVTNIAGTPYSSGSADGTGAAARFNYPGGIALDGIGNLYVADTFNHTIRRVVISTGVVTTVAGSAGVPGSANGTGTAATFNTPTGIVIGSGGNLYVTDRGSHIIRQVTPAGTVTTLAGTPNQFGDANGTGVSAKFYNPLGIAADSSGNLYVADNFNDLIRKVTPSGMVSTFAGSGASGAVDGTGTAASFSQPSAVTVDATGNVFVADSGNHAIRRITPSGEVSTYAGFVPRSGATDGPGVSARFNGPFGITTDSTGNVVVADYVNRTIRRITPGGTVTTVAGTAGASAHVDGMGASARFVLPAGVAVNAAGTIYVADYYGIRQITSSGAVSTLAGQSNSSGSVDGTGSSARFNIPQGITLDSNGDLVVSESQGGKIRKVTSAGVVTTLATGLNTPVGVAINGSGEIFVAEQASHSIKKVSGGVVSTFAGDTAGSPGRIDGVGTSARFNRPTGLTIDASGFLYVTEEKGHTIRRISPSGIVASVGGVAGLGTYADGIGNGALFSAPKGITLSNTGVLYVSDSANNRIAQANTAAALTTLEAWRQFYFQTTANSGNAANGIDFDQDGFSNILEYAMGSNPASAADRPIYKFDNDASGLALSLVPPQSAGGVTLAAETSVDLTPQSWQVVPRINQGDRTVFRVAPSADPRRFIRFRVSVP